MSNSTVEIRLPHPALDAEDLAFYGLDNDASTDIHWPQRCPFTGSEPAGIISLRTQKKSAIHRFDVPASEEALILSRRDYSWIPRLGLWLSYGGVIGFFIVLFYAYSFSGGSEPSGTLFSMGLLSAALGFFGFYFVRLMQQFHRGYRLWSLLPGVQAKIIDISPYFTDLKFTFLLPEYAEDFRQSNATLNLSSLKEAGEENAAELVATAEDGSPSDYLAAGRAEERLGNADKAIAWYEKARQGDAQLHSAWKHIGANHLWLNRANLARKELAAYLERKPDDLEAVLLMASVLERQQDASGALELYDTVLGQEPDPEICERAGDLSFHTRQYQRAVDYLRTGLEQAPESFSLQAKLLESIQQTGSESALEKEVVQAADRFPSHAEEIRRRYSG